jgi:hypothetical protein
MSDDRAAVRFDAKPFNVFFHFIPLFNQIRRKQQRHKKRIAQQETGKQAQSVHSVTRCASASLIWPLRAR